MSACTFINAWVGQCKNGAINGDRCAEHADLKCDSCGAPATETCDATFGFVCGSPICDDCEHELTEEGVNYSGCRHVKKSEQRHRSWIVQEFIKEQSNRLATFYSADEINAWWELPHPQLGGETPTAALDSDDPLRIAKIIDRLEAEAYP